jgi:hypothetical protein
MITGLPTTPAPPTASSTASSSISIPDVPRDDWSPLLDLLGALLAEPLAPLGKTKATVEVLPRDAPYGTSGCCRWSPDTAAWPRQPDAAICILLQSSAALLPPGLQCSGSNGGADLAQAYAQVWRRLSDKRLTLRHWYARETLAGGRYWLSRFQGRTPPYHPVLLTLPGSVFILRPARGAKPRDIQETLRRWHREGLPAIGAPGDPADPARGPSAGGADAYRHNPWIPQNGYGEVVIDPHPSRRLQPSQEEWHEL